MEGKELFYAGSYTNMSWSRGEKGKGLYHMSFDLENGEMTCTGVTEGLVNPSFSVLDREGTHLYVINEVQPLNESAIGRITSFAVDRKDGGLTLLGETSSYGLSPCYIVLDKDEKNAFLTNYCGRCAVSIAMGKNKALGELVQKVSHEGSGPDKSRQKEPHPHSLSFDRTGRHLVVADLGIDKVMVYSISQQDGKPKMTLTGSASVDPGMGPRHVLFSGDGKCLYLVCEMGSRMYVFGYDEKTGVLTRRQDLSTLPAPCPGNCCAHLLLSPDGNYLYASNRGHDSIAVFRVNREDGTLTFLTATPSGGATPRNFAIDPSGRWLIAANQDSDTLVSFRRDEKTGLLTQASTLRLPAPVFIIFLK